MKLSRERSEEHTSELQSRSELVCRLLLEKQKAKSGFGVLEPALRSGSLSKATGFSRSAQPRWMATHSPSPQANTFFFKDTATTEIYTLSLHDALPISLALVAERPIKARPVHAGRGAEIVE